MPWKVTDVMEETLRFVLQTKEEGAVMAELCRQFGISRKTGYKWKKRFAEQGLPGLMPLSRRPRRSAKCVPKKTQAALLDLRRAHPTWGARKLLVLLERNHPGIPLCSATAAQDLFRRSGLIVPRKKRRKAVPSAEPLAHCQAANQVWCVDFKGWFCTGDGQRCDPLTVTDAHSRKLLCCQSMEGKTDAPAVRAVFETLFRRYGLPEGIRSDNGPPMASTGLGGLTTLSVWWMRLGIRLERIHPGKPQENGRHERMHRTLKCDAINPPAATLRAQQAAFDGFREEYNQQRPHESLGMQTPDSHYQPSPRAYSTRLQPVVYPDDFETRSVRGSGQMKWKGRDVRISSALSGQRIGLKPAGKKRWEVYFMTTLLGTFDEGQMRVQPLKPAAILAARSPAGEAPG